MTIDFVAVRCPKCAAVVMDTFMFRGIARPLCPRCRCRVTVHGAGNEVRVTAVQKKPGKLPTSKALALS